MLAERMPACIIESRTEACMYMRSPCCCTVQDSADGAETRYLNRCELSYKRVTKTEMARERERERPQRLGADGSRVS